MKKYRSYIFLSILVTCFLGLGYYFLEAKSKKVDDDKNTGDSTEVPNNSQISNNPSENTKIEGNRNPKSPVNNVPTKDDDPQIPVNVGSHNDGVIDSDNDGVIDSKDKCPDEIGNSRNSGCPIYIEPKLKKPFTEGDNANQLLWNSELKNRNLYKLTLKLTSQSSGVTFFEEDVSGMSKFTVPDENITGYNGKKTTVLLEITPLVNYVKIDNNNNLKDAKFFCKTPE